MAISGHRFEASLGITPDALLVSNEKFALIWCPFRCVEGHMSHSSRILQCCHPEQSSCTCEFGCRYSYNTRLAQFVFVKEPACFYEPQFGRKSLNISLSDYMFETKKKKKKKLQEKVLNWTCQTNSVCELLQIVNFDGYWTLMVWNFWQDSSYSTNQIIEPFLQVSWYTYWSVLYESIEHTDDTDYWTLFTSILIYLLERALWEYRAYWRHW